MPNKTKIPLWRFPGGLDGGRGCGRVLRPGGRAGEDDQAGIDRGEEGGVAVSVAYSSSQEMFKQRHDMAIDHAQLP